jgi:hypothetical protein
MPRGSAATPPDGRTAILVADRDALLSQAGKLGPMATVALNALVGWPARKVTQHMTEAAIRKYYSDKDDAFLMAEFENSLGLNVPIARFTPSEARRLFRFDVGHTASNGTLYLRHPTFEDRYIAPAEFSRILAREREAAFRQLAAALGARQLELVQASVKTKKELFGSKVSIPEAAADVGIKASFDSDGSFRRQVYATFGKPLSIPHVPADLEPWVAMDPDLRTMARARTEANQLSIRVNLEFKQTQSLGGQVAAKVAGRGLDIGGTYKELSHSTWSFEVHFWDRSEIPA